MNKSVSEKYVMDNVSFGLPGIEFPAPNNDTKILKEKPKKKLKKKFIKKVEEEI